MEIQDLFVVALMPVLKTLLIALVGLFLALDRVNILDGSARHHLNNLVFYIFFPSLLASNLVDSITATNIISLWFIPVSILITFVIGSALGYALSIITGTPKQFEGLVISCCAAGNMGNLPVIIIPAICAEKNNPFGDSSTCLRNGMAYVSLSMAMGAVFVWSFVFNIIRAYGTESSNDKHVNSTINKIEFNETSEIFAHHSTEPFLSNSPCSKDPEAPVETVLERPQCEVKVPAFKIIKQHMNALKGMINLKILLRPLTIATIVGLIIGIISPIRKVMVGDSAPLRVIESSVLLLGEAAIPSMTLIMGANLLRGLKRSGVGLSLVIGMIIVRFVLLPLCGIAVVKAAQNLGMVGSDPLYHFVLLLQYAVPPAMAIGTITQLFEIGETESSVLMFWNYAVAGIASTLWSTYFMWLLA